MTTSKHKCRLITETLERGETTAGQFLAMSNPNQYYNKLEDSEIMKWRWGEYGDADVKWWSIADKKKALDFLARHTRKPTL
jgi:hypothetical protein